MGNPRTDHHIIISGYSQASVRSVEALATTPAKLALGLADVLFTKDELSTSLVTKKEGRNLLDPDKVEGIRRKWQCCKSCVTLLCVLKCLLEV